MSESDPTDQRRIQVTRSMLRSRGFFFLTFVALLILTALLLKPFFSVILLSLIAVIVLKPLYGWFYRTKFTKGRRRLSASVTILTFLFILVVPVTIMIVLFIDQLSSQLVALADFDLDAIFQEIEDAMPTAGGQSITLDKQAIKQAIGDAAAAVLGAALGIAGKFLSALPKLIVDGMIFLVVVVTLLPEFDRVVEEMQEISPLGSEITELYYRKTTAMISSLFKGIFLIAALQGLVMGFFFWLAGVQSVFLFVMLSVVLAMIPVVGISFLVIFTAVVFLLSGNTTSAAIVLVGFYGVVNWIDVILRPRLISKDAYMHFSLVLLGILGGLAFAGLLGLFYGPVVILLLLTTIDIYRETYAKEDSAAIGELIRTEVAERLDEPESAEAGS
ncbi:MAG: AI-2E family transporter [Anaerolineales bacterium]